MSERPTRKFQKELNTGAISLVLLGLFSRRGKPMYGYEIAGRLTELSGDALPMNQGAIYPVLRSLERQGLLTSRLEPSDSGPPRRYYRLTPAGRGVFRDWKRAWRSTRGFVDSILEESHETGTRTARRAVSE